MCGRGPAPSGVTRGNALVVPPKTILSPSRFEVALELFGVDAFEDTCRSGKRLAHLLWIVVLPDVVLASAVHRLKVALTHDDRERGAITNDDTRHAIRRHVRGDILDGAMEFRILFDAYRSRVLQCHATSIRAGSRPWAPTAEADIVARRANRPVPHATLNTRRPHSSRFRRSCCRRARLAQNARGTGRRRRCRGWRCRSRRLSRRSGTTHRCRRCPRSASS